MLADHGVQPYVLVHVHHCFNCASHCMSTKHVPGSYEAKFAEIRARLEATLPHTLVAANHTPPTLGAFEVKGLAYRSDEMHILHSKLGSDVFPRPDDVMARAGKESEIPNFKGSYLGRFPLVSADFWTNDHLSERSRSVDAFP